MLGDTNPAIGTATQRYRTTRMRMIRSACEDEASADSGMANDQGAASCITAAEEVIGIGIGVKLRVRVKGPMYRAVPSRLSYH